MIRPEDARIQKMLDALEGLGLTEQELEKVEDYLRGDAGEEILQGFSFRDLTQVPAQEKQKCRQLSTEFANKKRYEELVKLLQVMFAVGQATCADVFVTGISILKQPEFCEQLKMPFPQVVSVFAQSMGSNRWFCRVHGLTTFYDFAGRAPENLRNALEYCKGNSATARLLIYTVYFWKKYPADFLKKNPSKQSAPEKSGFLGTITKFFGVKSAASEQETAAKEADVTGFGAQDALLLKQYEDILVHNIGALFSNTLPKETVENLQKAVREGRVSAQLCEQVKKATLNENLLDILGGCAYLNYMLSPVLKSVVMLCLAANSGKALDMFTNMDGRFDLDQNGGEYDTILGVEPMHLIAWAANLGARGYNGVGQKVGMETAKKILVTQFKRNREQFLEHQKNASLDASKVMLEVLKEVEPDLYKSMMGSGMEAQREKVMQVLTERVTAKTEALSYLRGETALDDLYKVAGNLNTGYRYGGGNEWRALSSFHETYQDQEFFQRVMIFMSLCEIPYFFRKVMKDAVNRKEEELIFNCLNAGGLNVEYQLHTVIMIADSFYHENDKKKVLDVASPIFLEYLKERSEETKSAFANAEAYARYFGLCVMEQEAESYKAEIMGFSQDSAKVVKEKLEEILKGKMEWRPEISALLASKKAAERELAIRVMLHWNTTEDLEALGKLLETEKNAKVRSLLEGVLQPEGEENGAPVGVKVLTADELVKNLHKGGKKRSLAWAYETPFSEVHKKNGEPAEEEYLQAILLCYTAMNNPGVSKDALTLAEDLNEAELAMYVNELFDKWLEAGAESKKRWVMYAASIHGGSDIVKKLHHQIQEWPQHARGAIAADAVQALALNPQPQALLLVDNIARKFKFKQVKAAAGKALEYAAEQLGLTREELEDKIVPNLGFDENMERHFDYGERSFTVTITPALEIEVFGEDGKKLKNLPAPGKKDDEEKANVAYEAFKEMKKQMKATVTSQKARLEAALSCERLWSIASWQELFVKNPVMHQFAIGLIWGIYEEHKLTQSFRYMEDGSFNTEDEEEYTLPQQGYIGLVHPIELSQESRDAWKQQLEDYEITQPIEQLNREIFYRSEEEEKGKSIERFAGMYVNDLSLNGKMQQLGWYRGEALDGGCFDTFYRTDASLGLCTELHFSGTYIACEGEDVTVYEARFYKIGEGNGWGYHIADEAKDTKALMLKDIPQRYFSEIVLQLTKATASSKERDEDWRKNR